MPFYSISYNKNDIFNSSDNLLMNASINYVFNYI